MINASHAQASAGMATSYLSSGRFSAMLLPLVAITAVIALAMAYVLFLAEAHEMYYYFFSPLICGAPALASVAAVVHFGKCRNTWLAATIGVAMALLFYIGYWQISYLNFSTNLGKIAPLVLKVKTGQQGLPGYFLYRCKVTKPQDAAHSPRDVQRPPTAADNIFNYVFFGGETLVLAFTGLGIGLALSRRAFFEKHDRWASSFSFLTANKDADATFAAIESQDWPALAAIPKLAHDAANPAVGCTRIKIEYLPGEPAAGLYLTAWQGNAGKSRSRAVIFLDRTTTGAIRQRFIDTDSAIRFHAAFPVETKYTGKVSSTPSARRIGTTPIPAPADPAAVRDSLCVAPDADISASTEAAAQPAEKDRLREIRRFDTVFTLWMVGSLGITMSTCLALIAMSDHDKSDAPMAPLQIALAAVFATGMAGMLMVILFFQKLRFALLARRLKARAGSLLNAPTKGRREGFKVYFANQFHLKEKATDDVAIVVADTELRRLLIEGIRYRYVIPASAISSIQPLQSDTTLAIQIDFILENQPLSFILARTNGKGHWQHHLPFLSTAKDAQKVVTRLLADLGLAE